MPSNGLFDGFESYRVLGGEQIREALGGAIVALDTNVLLNLYRYNEQTVEDILAVLGAAQKRLFVPHQVAREFWRNRQGVLAVLGNASRDAKAALRKNASSTSDAVERWAKSTALPSHQLAALQAEVDAFFAQLADKVSGGPVHARPQSPTADDDLLTKLLELFNGAVGDPLDEAAWTAAVAEGQRRVEESEPPGYMDKAKLESDLPEGASGDYLVWHQLVLEGTAQRCDLVLVTADTKEDWWNRGDHGAPVGPRRELIEEYLQATGARVFLLEPVDLIRHSTALGVETRPESVRDIEQVRDEGSVRSSWTREAVDAVIVQLDVDGYTQADVIRECIENGGRVTRERVFEIDERDESFTLRGFTKPVQRTTAELQYVGAVPLGVQPLLSAIYETGVRTSHFEVPAEVVSLYVETSDQEE